MDVAMKTNQLIPFVVTALIALATLTQAGCTNSEPPSAARVISLQPASEIIGAALSDHSVTTIHIDQKPVTNADLEVLRDNRIITNLLLDESEVTDDGMRIISTMPNLIHIRIRSKLTDTCIEDLLKLPALQFLNLPFADFTDEGLERLAQHPRIQLLRLRSPRVTDQAMPAIASMKNLAFLHFIEIPLTDDGLEAFYEASNLQSLYLDDCQTTDQGLSLLLQRQPKLHLHVNQAHLDNDPQKDNHNH